MGGYEYDAADFGASCDYEIYQRHMDYETFRKPMTDQERLAVWNALIDACIAAYIEDTGLTAASQLKAAVLAATGKTPEQIYGIDEVTR